MLRLSCLPRSVASRFSIVTLRPRPTSTPTDRRLLRVKLYVMKKYAQAADGIVAVQSFAAWNQ